MKKTVLIFIASAAMFLAGCTNMENSSDEVDTQNQQKLQKEAQAETGMPGIHNFTEKKMVKMLYELRDNPNLVNYAYLWSEVSGKWVYFGKCVGYGVPYSTQYSNPERLATYEETPEHGNVTLPQAEPNGLYMPSTSAGTWLMMINPDKPSDIKPVYVEPNVIVSPFKLPVQ
jgi:hypothetical protein